MGDVACLVDKRYKKLAEKFVEIYVKDGDVAAGIWATTELKEHNYDDFRPYVWDEFKKQGYEIVPFDEEHD